MATKRTSKTVAAPQEEAAPPLPDVIDPAQETPARKPRKKSKRTLRQEAIERKKRQRARDKSRGITEITIRVPEDRAHEVRDLARRLVEEAEAAMEPGLFQADG